MPEEDAARRQKIRLDLDFWPEEPPGPSHFQITFLPAGVTCRAEKGMSVFEAAREAQVAVPTECGGKGTCARCRVILPPPVRPSTYFERQFIGRDDLARGIRLACRTRVDRDMIVHVLPDVRWPARRPR